MVFYQDKELMIRNMENSDAKIFFDEFTAQGWHPSVEYYLQTIREQAEGKCVALTAVYRGNPAGYVYLYRTVNEGPFKGKGYPIVVNFNVLKKYQRKGIGNRLMDVAEQIAKQYADTVCLGVGLCEAYGSAQRMYAKRGYIPDGSGVWYRGKPCVQYKTVCTVDDDLLLFLSKKLTDD
jgi:GNAT superfamily N-acetyltransferase